MALTIEANYSKKVGLPGYSSHQFSLSLKAEITDLNQVPAEAARLVSNPNWAMQEKQDGRRLMLRKTGNAIEGINKRGLVVRVPEPIVQTARPVAGEGFRQ